MSATCGYMGRDELNACGFRAIGAGVQIDRSCCILCPENITLGSNVRIDAFTTLACSSTGFLSIGSYVHVGGYCYIAASHGVEIADFAGLSQGCRVYSASDDYSGEFMTNPTVPISLRHVEAGVVRLGRHAIVGSGSVIMPAVSIGEGTAVGALSFVAKSLDQWSIYFGSPARKVGPRADRAATLEREALALGIISLP